MDTQQIPYVPSIPLANKRLRINIERTSTNKYRIDKTVELTDLDLTDPADRQIAEATMDEANNLIVRDIRDLNRKLAALGGE